MDKFIEPLIFLFKNILIFFNTFTNSWGWSIVLLTILIKVVLFPTMLKQARVMDKMKKIQPKLKEIQDKYKDKPEEYQRRTMELYKQEKVNPFGSCLPMLIQLPLLIGLFYLLSEPKYMGSLIQNSTFLWFHLQSKNSISLAIISAVTTFLQTKLTTPYHWRQRYQPTGHVIFYAYLLRLYYLSSQRRCWSILDCQ